MVEYEENPVAGQIPVNFSTIVKHMHNSGAAQFAPAPPVEEIHIHFVKEVGGKIQCVKGDGQGGFTAIAPFNLEKNDIVSVKRKLDFDIFTSSPHPTDPKGIHPLFREELYYQYQLNKAERLTEKCLEDGKLTYEEMQSIRAQVKVTSADENPPAHYVINSYVQLDRRVVDPNTHEGKVITHYFIPLDGKTELFFTKDKKDDVQPIFSQEIQHFNTYTHDKTNRPSMGITVFDNAMKHYAIMKNGMLDYEAIHKIVPDELAQDKVILNNINKRYNEFWKGFAELENIAKERDITLTDVNKMIYGEQPDANPYGTKNKMQSGPESGAVQKKIAPDPEKIALAKGLLDGYVNAMNDKKGVNDSEMMKPLIYTESEVNAPLNGLNLVPPLQGKTIMASVLAMHVADALARNGRISDDEKESFDALVKELKKAKELKDVTAPLKKVAEALAKDSKQR